MAEEKKQKKTRPNSKKLIHCVRHLLLLFFFHYFRPFSFSSLSCVRLPAGRLSIPNNFERATSAYRTYTVYVPSNRMIRKAFACNKKQQREQHCPTAKIGEREKKRNRFTMQHVRFVYSVVSDEEHSH